MAEDFDVEAMLEAPFNERVSMKLVLEADEVVLEREV